MKITKEEIKKKTIVQRFKSFLPRYNYWYKTGRYKFLYQTGRKEIEIFDLKTSKHDYVKFEGLKNDFINFIYWYLTENTKKEELCERLK